MKSIFLSAIAVAAFVSFAPAAFADDAADRAAAVALCRSEVARQAGVDADAVRLDQARTRSRQFRVDLDLWRNGELTNVRCTVDRSGDGRLTASIEPALATETASAR